MGKHCCFINRGVHDVRQLRKKAKQSKPSTRLAVLLKTHVQLNVVARYHIPHLCTTRFGRELERGCHTGTHRGDVLASCRTTQFSAFSRGLLMWKTRGVLSCTKPEIKCKAFAKQQNSNQAEAVPVRSLMIAVGNATRFKCPKVTLMSTTYTTDNLFHIGGLLTAPAH